MKRFKNSVIKKGTTLPKPEGFGSLLPAIAASLFFTSGLAHAVTTYTMKDIGISPTAINSTGKVLGSNYMLYDNGTLTSIRAMTAPAVLTQGFDINTAGQVVGYGTSTGSAFIRNPDGTYVNVGPSPDPNFRPGAALTINDAGQVAGLFATLSTTGVLGCTTHAFLGSATSPEVIDLGTLGGNRTNVSDINANGIVVGQSSVPTAGSVCPLVPNYHAFVFSKTVGMKDLHSTSMFGNDSVAYKINVNNVVVGNFANGLTVPDSSGYYPNGYPVRQAAIWNLDTGTYKNLGNGSRDSSLQAINDSGVAVGFERTITSYPCNGCAPTTTSQNAVLVESNGTALLDLNTLVQGLPAGWTLLKANDINNAGQIIALARDSSGVSHGVMLTPNTSTVTPPPSAPSGLAATVISDTQLNLTWLDNATNENSQVLERCQGNGCSSFTTIATLAPGVTSYNDAGLTASTQYSYRIKAQGASGTSGYSNTVSATTAPPAITPIPAAPSNLNATATSRGRIVLSWTDNANNEKNFVIERCLGLGCTNFTAIATVAANSVSFNNYSLQRNTTYSYRVKAINASGSSNYSNIDYAKTFN